MDDERAPTPEESLALINAQRRQVRDQVRVDARLLYGAWGLAWSVGYVAMFLTVEPDGNPGGAGPVVFFGLMVLAVIITIVHSSQRSRGLGGAAAKMDARLGISWPVAFMSTFFIFGGIFRHGLDGPGIAVVTNAFPCLVVATIFMCTGAAWHDTRQFWLGVWIAVVTAVASIVGPPYLLLVMAVLGGGGFLAGALHDHLQRRRADG